MNKFVTAEMIKFLGHFGWISVIGLPAYFVVDSWLINTCHFNLLKQPSISHFLMMPFFLVSAVVYFHILKLFDIASWAWKPGLFITAVGVGYLGWKLIGMFAQLLFH